MRNLSLYLGLSVILLTPVSSFATPTQLTVRVKSKDAKFVGTGVGGVLITVKDALTGEVLATGRTAGDTGDTERIMKTPVTRGALLATATAAHFTAALDLTEPRLIEVTAYGPLANLQAANRVSATQWIVPGKHITDGDAWLMELPGFVVDVLAPPTHIKLKGTPQTVQLAANVMMMCGCPITPGGVWDADKYEVKALLKKDGAMIGDLALHYAGTTSQFAGTWTVQETGVYEAVVYAYDPTNGNTGVDSVTFVVDP
ncbi:MAG: hypothetical protein AB7P69_19400 [Candidatus Binatia bacterium]